MKKIKFRGKIIHMSEIVYGSCVERKSADGERNRFIIDDAGAWANVKNKSVAQFVGYDKNGNEIYSDDKIRVYEYNCYGIGGWVGPDIAENFFTIADIGKTFDNVEVYMDNENEN